jgi:hypothetical protein
MALSAAFRPMGLVLLDVFSVRDGWVSVFGLVWWMCSHVAYLIMITLTLFVLLSYINLFVTYGLSHYLSTAYFHGSAFSPLQSRRDVER